MRYAARLTVLVFVIAGLTACGSSRQQPQETQEPRVNQDSLAQARADSAARADSIRRARERERRRQAEAADLCEQATAAVTAGNYDEARELFRRAKSDYAGTDCAERADAELDRLEVVEVVRDRIHFEFDESNITDEAAEVLQRKAEVLRDNPGTRIVIEGHCDERGSNEYNMALGQRRASSAEEYLIELGVPEEAIVRTVSYGEERPLVDRSNEEAWAQNRRAEFVIQGLGEL